MFALEVSPSKETHRIY